jgi:hypothetical protein
MIITRVDDLAHAVECEECGCIVQPGERINIVNNPGDSDAPENRMLCTQCLIKELA